MKGHYLKSIVDQISAMVGSPTTDVELLKQFQEQRDETAFAQLVRRHGPLVWSVARQMLNCDQDAEDAFQATFLVLFRSATTIRKQDRLPNWLHGVTVRVSLKIRRAATARKRREELSARSEADAPSNQAWIDLMSVVHEEVSRLPEGERLAFVSCCLEGLSQEEAANKLGWKLGTLSGRLTRARQRLLDRLARRGIAPAIATASVVSSGVSLARAPETVISKVFFTQIASRDLSPIVLELAQGVVEMSMRAKLLSAAIMMTVGTAVMLGGNSMGQSEQAPRSKPTETKPTVTKSAESPRPKQAPPEIRNFRHAVWEYRSVRSPVETIHDDELNRLGSEGWEICSTREHVTVFKRLKSPAGGLISAGAFGGGGLGEFGRALMEGSGSRGFGSAGGGSGRFGGGNRSTETPPSSNQLLTVPATATPINPGPPTPQAPPPLRPATVSPAVQPPFFAAPAPVPNQKATPVRSTNPSSVSDASGGRPRSADPAHDLTQPTGPSNSIPVQGPPSVIPPVVPLSQAASDVKPRTARIFSLKHAQAAELSQVLSMLVIDQNRSSTNRTRMVADPRTNSIVVIADETTIEQIKELIQQLDAETPKQKSPPQP